MRNMTNAELDSFWSETNNWANRLNALALLPSVQADDDLWNDVMNTSGAVADYYERMTGDSWIDDPAG